LVRKERRIAPYFFPRPLLSVSIRQVLAIDQLIQIDCRLLTELFNEKGMKKAKKFLYFFVVALLLFFSCKPSQKITSSWVNPERPSTPYKTVFVAVLLQNNQIKYALEDNLAAAAKARGFNVVKGYEIFPPNFNKDNMRDKDLVLRLIRERGCDVILSVAVIDEKSETRYVSGMSMSYVPYGGYGPYGTYGTYGVGFYGYYNYWSTSLYDPGYYTTDKTYFLEANAYDTETQKLVWSVQSKAFNPSGIEKSSNLYTDLLMEQFDKDRKK
jgi:hypothetical protein